MKIGPIICDPRTKEARDLIGKRVVFTDDYVRMDKKDEKDIRVLDSIDVFASCPFIIKFLDGTTTGFKFISEVIEEPKKYIPYDTSDPEVRDKLRGKWYRLKEDNSEFMVDHITVTQDGRWLLNSRNPREFLNDCVWLDGSQCGEEVIE